MPPVIVKRKGKIADGGLNRLVFGNEPLVTLF
jgi:hypothetical protein